MKNQSKKGTSPPGSLNDLQDKIRAQINQQYNNDPLHNKELYPADIIPETPITAGNIIIENYSDDKYYEIPFTTDETGNIILGEAVEVERNTTYNPVQKGVFVFKDEDKRLVTGPVDLPGCPDCDFQHGEKIRSVEDVEGFCHAFNDFRLSDAMHLYGATGNIVGKVVENWTLKEELTTKNINDEEVTLPVGTWMATTKITDDKTWNKIKEGTYQGYSGTYLSNDDAMKLLETLQANKSESNLLSTVLASVNKRTLIKDLKDPTPVTISIVDRPCVPNAIFTSVKSQSDKAGRSISNNTLSKLQSAYDKVIGSLDNLKQLIKQADNERTSNTDVTKKESAKMEVDEMDEKELAELIGTKFDEKIKPVTDEIEAIKNEIKETDEGGTVIKCKECEHELEESDKFCSSCGDAIKTETEPVKVESIKLEENETIMAMQGQLDAISEKLGIQVESQKISGQEPQNTVHEGPVSTKEAAVMVAKRRGFI